MGLANASLLDEATAAAEAVTMARRVSRSKADTFFVDSLCHPQTIAVVRTRAAHLGIHLVVGDPLSELEGHDLFGALLQYPATDGSVRDLRPAIKAVQAKGGLAAVATDLLALCLLTPPGELGADIALGSAQRFGVPLGYGGPHAAFFATKDAHKRAMPGRIIGVSVDSRGRTALRMALQTREQHIRREKATSNICTAQVLLANIAGMFAVWHGPEGLTRIATRTYRLTAGLAEGLRRCGVEVVNAPFFDTLTLRVPDRAHDLLMRARDAGIDLRYVDRDHLGVSLDQTSDAALVARLLGVLGGTEGASLDPGTIDGDAPDGIPAGLRRASPFLTPPGFHRYRSETEMMRYLRRLAAKDIALDRSMIPLGSCTMKLNAAAEMIPVTWPGFANLHPFAPADQAKGYQQLFRDLAQWLGEITGFDAVSLQPNAGSQGEYAGLLVIRAWHEHRGEGHRDVCLIPSSAHGTNPASAIMAGMRVVVVGCDRDGNVDLADLRAKADVHADRLPAPMGPYPSTHGVFEAGIRDICGVVHERGGQVYMDGANLNALVGLARPAEFGADVCHINLHKTFCIPHGGGGPGMGPIAVKAHLAPYLPNHPLVPGVNPYGEGTSVGPVAAAPWGSASILPISWASIPMMGGGGPPLGLGLDPADLLGLHRDDGRRGPHPRHRGRDPERQLRRQAPLAPLPGRLHRRERPRGARVHRRHPPDQGADRDHGRGHRQAPRRLRLPRAHHVVARARDHDDRADRVGVAGRDRPLLRRDDRDPRGDPGRRARRGGPEGQPGQAGTAYGRPADGRLGPALRQGAGVLPRALGARGQVLAAGRPRRQRLRRPSPGL